MSDVMSDLGTIVKEPGFDLSGAHLVAASAGTGKTYSIQSLYLRLILQGMTVQRILVVTFTEAATKELRDRLRNVLRDAVRYVENPRDAAPDERIAALVALVPSQDREQARHAVRTALLDFDLAAIHTIHGFCLRTLARFAFETGQSFDTTPVTSSTEELDRLCEDWWRANLYRARRERAALAGLSGLTFAALTAFARRLVAKPDAVPVPEPLELEEIPAKVREALARAMATVGSIELPCAEEWPEEGRRVGREILDAIARCREAGGREAWEEAGDELCRAQGLQWESAPWRLPFDAAPIHEACSRLCDAVKGKPKKKFLLQDGRLAYGGVDLVALDNELRRALAPIHDGMALIGDRRRFPHKGAAEPHKTYTALVTLDAYVQGQAADGETVIESIRTVEKSPPDSIPGVHTVSLKKVAPAWAEAAAAIQAGLPGLLSGAALHVKRAYEGTRRARETLSFDDYLANLRAALNGDSGPALREALRGEYKAALIDEFQDTDPVQYAIFNAIFPDDSAAPCFLVGDPKQAIYRFRNGDIETYVRATRKITASGRRHELATNYRSEARLVAAVNQLFADTAARRTFGCDEMAYDGRLAARGKPDGECLTRNGVIDARPFLLWHFDGGDGPSKIPGLNHPKARAIWRQTAAGIRRLLEDDALRIGVRRVRPNDIAVLVMTHGEAAAIETELVARGIPVVRQGAQRVFDTAEAREFWVFLAAMAEPRDLRRVRAALTTRLLGIPISDVLALVSGAPCPLPHGWPRDAVPSSALGEDENAVCGQEHWAALFGGLRKTWDASGLAAAFSDFARRSGLRSRLARLPRGERVLTNFLQLVELAHRAAMEERLPPEGTLAWLKELLASEERNPNDDYELRLETDDDAVKIMTVFKSKGLEFPIVFVPTLWRRSADGKARDGLLEYHDQGRLVIEAGGTVGKDQAIVEAFAENTRLAYVALTRAVHRTVLVWGDFKAKPEQHSLAWLLGAETTADELRTTFGDDSAITVESCRWDEPVDATRYRPGGGDQDAQKIDLVLPGLPSVEKGFGHASFSTLAPHAGVDAPETDRDEVSGEGSQAEEEPAAVSPIFVFPAGATTGTCWHKVFEVLPFDADEALIRRVCEEQLQSFGLTRRIAQSVRDERIIATVDMVASVLEAPLPPLVDGETAFALRTVADVDRRNEWAFSFPSARRMAREPLRTSAITSLLRTAWSGDEGRRLFLERIQSWDRAIPGGYLTGFLDVLFRRNGRYYIVDWKSNRRGGHAADFEADGLRDEMARHAYFLQYLFYAVAVHQYLSQAVPGYDYGCHFGGVYYVFLRGVDGKTGRGIFADRPAKALVEGLSAVLGEFR